MTSRSISASLISVAVILGSTHTAAAGDAGAAFVGGLLGSAIGSAVVNQQHKRVVVQKRYVPRTTVNSYQREENRRVQTALNYFGFPAGVADGVLGANSRAAIGQYQAFMGTRRPGR
jgi:hypothetical protein